MTTFRERNGYKGIETSINGVSFYLSERGFLKDRDDNKKMKELGQIVRDFLIQENLPVRIKKRFCDIDWNCKQVQKCFDKFSLYVKKINVVNETI